ncbi:Kinesin-like protein KIFC3 [Symbiodinium microadriaticum]|uniref:Kinesin-like protein KIFC3 n=1 Tax=Symbiodinium microadriaticum TaxID=2951 RepID=A0A1Q9CMN6_SYMMI|nr:Kinesin-like protein KIFC3 [Symbiodinium microadriaticum]
MMMVIVIIIIIIIIIIVIVIVIITVNRKDNSQYLGKINLIDLAGSENVNKSGVQGLGLGQGMREAQNINKSLFALGDARIFVEIRMKKLTLQVIASLVSKNSKSAGHVPYRNSKLTMMLKAQSNVTETLSSLNFASRARNVELGKAKQHKS